MALVVQRDRHLQVRLPGAVPQRVQRPRPRVHEDRRPASEVRSTWRLRLPTVPGVESPTTGHTLGRLLRHRFPDHDLPASPQEGQDFKAGRHV